MGEYIAASIQFGGRLREEHVEELLDLLNDKGLTVDSDESTKPRRDNLSEEFGDYQINYGDLDELVAFGRSHGLHYRYWFDSGPEWEAQSERYYPDVQESFELVGEGAIRRSDIERLGSYAAILAHFERAERPVPALEIEP